MPQFDLAVFIPQIFWLVICFTALYSFTVGYSMPRLKKIYDNRWQHSEGTRIEAVKIHRQAQDLSEALEKERNQARKKVGHLVSTRLRQISQETTDEKNEILAEMKKRYTKGELLVTERKMAALIEAQPLVEKLSTDIILKLMQDRVPSKLVKAMVTQSLKRKP